METQQIIEIKKDELESFAISIASFNTYVAVLLKKQTKPVEPELTKWQQELLALAEELQKIGHRLSNYTGDYSNEMLTKAEVGIHHSVEDIRKEVYSPT